MSASLFNCWNCDKKLQEKRAKIVTKGRGKKKTTKTLIDDLFFYCDAKCRDEHEKRIEKQHRPIRQWSAYMCGERDTPPRKFAHLVEQYGWPKDQKQITVDEDEPETKSTGRKCGKCGKPGHNARTCGKQKKAPAKKRPAPPKKVVKKKRRGKKAPTKARRGRKKAVGRTQYRCGICEGLGHNARTCDKRPPEAGEFEIKPAKPKKVGKYKCGICSEMGHNARTCPKR